MPTENFIAVKDKSYFSLQYFMAFIVQEWLRVLPSEVMAYKDKDLGQHRFK